jgi:SpoVK/Ycf46/Vps4 family AAA+-type ATPase
MTEKILDKILKSIVKRTDIALVIDDAEFLMSRTMAVHEVHVSEISLILNFLQKPVRPLTILTSNSPTLIDPAILRPGRIDVAIVIGYPDKEARKVIIENLLKKYGADVRGDIVENLVVATRWMSNAEIDALIRMALSKGSGKITIETIEWARKRFRIDYNVRASEHQFMRWSISHMPGLVITYIPQDHEI